MVSVVFALAVGANISDPSILTLRTQELFIAPFLLNIGLVLVLGRKLQKLVFVSVVDVANVIALLLYQWIVLGAPSVTYIVLAPLVPAVILATTARISHPSTVTPPLVETDSESPVS